MEPKGLLLLSQKTSTCSYPKPDKSGPSFPSYFLKIYFNIILLSPPRYSKYPPCLSFPHTNTSYTNMRHVARLSLLELHKILTLNIFNYADRLYLFLLMNFRK
jgi:hypothetical protein